VSDHFTSRRQVLGALGAAGVAGVAGCGGLLEGDSTAPTPTEDGDRAETGDLQRLWITDNRTEYPQNHHEMGVTHVDGEPLVGVPRSENPDTEGCGLAAVGPGGEQRWQHRLPAAACDPHAVGDVGVGTLDGEAVFLVSTIQGSTVGYSAATGAVRFEADLVETIPYGAPVLTPPGPDGSRRVVVVDNNGNLVVAYPDGSIAWKHAVDGVVYPSPVVRDVDGDGVVEIVVATDVEDGWVIALDIDGSVRWRETFGTGGREIHPLDQGDRCDVAISTWEGVVAVLDGTDGTVRWSEEYANRGILGETAGNHLYASEGDGIVHAIDPADGSVEWTVDSIETDAPANAPVVGQVGPDSPLVAALGYDGTLALIDAETGTLDGQYSFDQSTYTSPLLVDLTDDDSDEILIMFGDSRVGAYSIPG